MVKSTDDDSPTVKAENNGEDSDKGKLFSTVNNVWSINLFY